MAFQPGIKMCIVDSNNPTVAYKATLNPETSEYDVISAIGLGEQRFIKTLPEGWDGSAILWDRHVKWRGVFRSQSDTQYKWTNDARAILQHLMYTYGVQALATLQVWECKNDESAPGANDYWRYEKVFETDFDFKTFKDYPQNLYCTCGTLDAKLYRLLAARASTQYNIPFWNWNGESWETDAIGIQHPGIKLRYQADFTSSAKPDDPLIYDFDISPRTQLAGWNNGAQGDGYHIIFPLVPFNIVQNNGTTTFIGNDILQPFIIQNTQNPGAANFGSESSFNEINHSQPYTRENYAIKCLLPDQDEISCSVVVDASILDQLGVGIRSNKDGIVYMVMFEIDENNMPTMSGADPTRFATPQVIAQVDIVSGDNAIFGIRNVNNPTAVTLKNNKVYVFGMIADNPADPFGGDGIIEMQFTKLTFSLRSNYDSGASGAPVAGPRFPASAFLAYRPHQVFEKLVKYLPTINTDGYGFPVPVDTVYSGYSAFLSDPARALDHDARPYNVALTSGYAIHDLSGQSYMTTSLDQLFDFLNKQFSVGLELQADEEGNLNTVRIENVEYFFDETTCIVDFGFDVSDIKVEPLSSGMGANLKAGYQKADTNADFGVDPFITELYYNTPLTAIHGVMEYQHNGVLCEQYAIEKVRAQRVNQPVGQSYDPANPSGDNVIVGIYIKDNSDPDGALPIFNPDNTGVYGGPNYKPYMHSDAQSTDPTAATAPYVYGMYYPDTAINLQLSPVRGLYRNGRWMGSWFDGQEDSYLTFRKTSVMQYNNKVQYLSGIESNLTIGGTDSTLVKEFKDIKISDLGTHIFRPYTISFTSKYPVNLYKIIADNPRGYMQCKQRTRGGAVKVFKGYLFRAKQIFGNQAATEFTLIAMGSMEF